jgi:hypothetical protein
MHYLLRLISIKASTCFEHVFAHYQEVLYIQQLLAASRHTTHKIYQLLYIYM